MYNMIESFWQSDYYFPSYDVVIVGGGFTGLVAGIELLLKKPKLKVGIFESQTHGTLASSRNAGFMCFGSPTELLADIDQHGVTAVTNLLKLKTEGYATLLKHLAGNKDIYKKTFGYELIESSVQGNIAEQLPQLNEMLLAGTGIADYYTYQPTYPANPTFAAIRFKQEGQLHPTAAVAALTRKFMNLGGVFHAGTSITAWGKTNNGYSLECSLEKEISTRKLIVANNAFASELLPDYFVQPQRAQVLVTAPFKNLPYRGNFHMDQGYVYFRNIGNRLLLGGLRNTDFETEATATLALNHRIQENLEKLLTLLMPQEKAEITHRWTGIMGFRAGKIPALHLHESGIIVAAGMNGMGTLLGPALGKQAAFRALRP